MNSHKIPISTFCLVGMILIHESDGKTCQQNGGTKYQLKSVGNPKTWNVKTMRNSTKIRRGFQGNPTAWFFNSRTGRLYCCHNNDTYYMVVNRKNGVELSTSPMANDRWKRSYVKKIGRRIFQHKSSKSYLTVKRNRLYLSNEPKHVISMLRN